MTKPLIITTIYSQFIPFQKELEDIGAVFTTRDVLSNFWGLEFTIKKPRGEGAKLREKQILELCDPTIPLWKYQESKVKNVPSDLSRKRQSLPKTIR